MAILSKSKKPKVIKDSKLRRIGREGERKVSFRLRQLYQLDETTRYIDDVIIVDNYGNSHQIDHIAIRHNGVFCIETKNIAGYIFGSVNGDTWTQALAKDVRNSYVSPIVQNKTHVKVLKEVIGDRYKVNSVIVLARNNSRFITNKPSNVINVAGLIKYLRNYDDGVYLSNEEIINIYNDIIDASSDMSLNEHINNIKGKA